MASQTAYSARFCLSLMLAAATLAPVPARPATLAGPYQSTVPQHGRGAAAQQAAFAEALRDVIVRITGRRDAPGDPALAGLLADAPRYVQTIRPAAGGQVTVSFDSNAVENAIAAAGLPYWGAERPAVLVWLAVDRGANRRVLVGANVQNDERRTIERAAAQRGLPLVWPATRSGDEASARYDDVFADRRAPLQAAAGRYGADGVLIGKAIAGAGGLLAVSWTFTSGGTNTAIDGQLADGVHLAADQYASQYASTDAARLQEVALAVTGIDNLTSYAAAIKAVESVSVVRGVAVGEVTPGAVTLRVTVRGDAAALRRAIVLGNRLVLKDGAGDTLLFQLRP